MESIKPSTLFKISENIDCQDTCGKWLNARIIDLKIDQANCLILKVTYTDFGDKYDEWIDSKSPRILKQF